MIIRMFVYHPMRDEVTTYVVNSSRQVCLYVCLYSSYGVDHPIRDEVQGGNQG